jgi:hypothetical protein
MDASTAAWRAFPFRRAQSRRETKLKIYSKTEAVVTGFAVIHLDALKLGSYNPSAISNERKLAIRADPVKLGTP